MYADASCFSAASFHKDTVGVDEAEMEDDHRGCSPFVLENFNQLCQNNDFGGVAAYNCKDTCDSNNCNTNKYALKKQCYSCSGTRDSDGNPVGVGDDS